VTGITVQEAPIHFKGPGGGIGRHTSLRGWRRNKRASSSLVLGTKNRIRGFFLRNIGLIFHNLLLLFVDFLRLFSYI
jgi:hypothetical protein